MKVGIGEALFGGTERGRFSLNIFVLCGTN
jgi:hypothetical protein